MSAPVVDHARPLKVTVRVDGSFDYATGVAGVGLVVHETRRPEGGRQGEVVADLAEAHLEVAPGDVQAFAILRALEVAEARGAAPVRLRSTVSVRRARAAAGRISPTMSGRGAAHGKAEQV